MPLISNGIKSKKVGKSGLDNRIYQPFYSFLEHFKKYAEINTEKVSLSTGPLLYLILKLCPCFDPFDKMNKSSLYFYDIISNPETWIRQSNQ